MKADQVSEIITEAWDFWSGIRSLPSNTRLERVDEHIEKTLQLHQRGFQRVFQESKGVIGYESGLSRVKFVYYMGHHEPTEDELREYYGRSHAPFTELVIEYQGTRCFCWHHPYILYAFLEGLRPTENLHDTLIEREFKHSSLGQALLEKGLSSEFRLRLLWLIWQKHAQRLFCIFDPNEQELWNTYRAYYHVELEQRKKRDELVAVRANRSVYEIDPWANVKEIC